MVVGVLMVITVLLSCGIKCEILLYTISILDGYSYIPDLLQQELPGSAKHECTISVEVYGM
jgi:hypothetical protein